MPVRHLYNVQLVKDGHVHTIMELMEDIMSVVSQPSLHVKSKTRGSVSSNLKSPRSFSATKLAPTQVPADCLSAAHCCGSTKTAKHAGKHMDVECLPRQAPGIKKTRRLTTSRPRPLPDFRCEKEHYRAVPHITSEQRNAVKAWLHDLDMDISPFSNNTGGGDQSCTHVLDDPLRNGALYGDLLLSLGLTNKSILQVKMNLVTFWMLLFPSFYLLYLPPTLLFQCTCVMGYALIYPYFFNTGDSISSHI